MSNVQSLDETSCASWEVVEAPTRVSLSIEQRIDDSPWSAFLSLSVFYFAAVFVLSHTKLLWLDELITLHIARLSSVAAIWNALARGADPNPPVTHLLVHVSRMVFGDHEFAYRLPAAIGYWVGMLSLFQYLRSRIPVLWALGGTVLSMTMAAFDYSYESRSYGIFCGLAMLAFYCWTCTADETRSRGVRTLAMFGMILALAAGVSTNYFAVLAFLPIAVGEIVRSILRAREDAIGSGEERRWRTTHLLQAIDWRVWIGLSIAATPLIAYRGLIAHSITQFAPYAWNKVSLDRVADSYTEMVEAVLYPILALFVFAIVIRIVSRRVTRMCPICRAEVVPRWMHPLVDNSFSSSPISWHEAAGVFCFMIYPMLGYVIASIRGGMLSPRFVIPVCFGFAISAALIAYQLFSRMRRAGLVFLCFLLAWFLCRESVVGYWYEQQKVSFHRVLESLPQAESHVSTGVPIAIPDPLLALTLQHYAPPAVASRIVFPVDFPAIRRYRHDDSPEENLWAGRDLLYSLRIMPVADFQNSAHQYLIIASKANWYVDDLRRHHYLVTRLPIKTRATEMGGFTPLAKGTPGFFTASWDNPLLDISSPLMLPIPFRASEEMPDSKPLTGAGL